MKKPSLEKRHFEAMLRLRSKIGPKWRIAFCAWNETGQWPEWVSEDDFYLIKDIYCYMGAEDLRAVKLIDLLKWVSDDDG